MINTGRWRPLLWAVVWVGCVLLLMLQAKVAIETSETSQQAAETAEAVRASQISNTETLDAALDASQRIRDCTTPGEKCFEASQERLTLLLGEPVGPINTVVTLAAVCIDRPGSQTFAEAKACVDLLQAEFPKKVGDK